MRRFDKRLSALEAQPPPTKWRFNTYDLSVGWGGVNAEEKEFLEGLTLDEATKLSNRLYAIPLSKLKELAADSAFCRFIHYARVLRHYDAPDPEEIAAP